MEKGIVKKEITSIQFELLQGGQVAPYKDTIYVYKVTSTYECHDKDKFVENFCTKVLRPSKNKGFNFNGSCNFPFGLDRYHSLTKNEDGSYTYKVCDPYTG